MRSSCSQRAPWVLIGDSREVAARGKRDWPAVVTAVDSRQSK
jgi:hypothetical protein